MHGNRKYPLDEKFFDIINDDNAYILGLWYSDGNICQIPINILKDKIIKPTNIITKDIVIEIKKLLISNKYTQMQIAKMFSIHHSIISDIKLKKTWKHVEI